MLDSRFRRISKKPALVLLILAAGAGLSIIARLNYLNKPTDSLVNVETIIPDRPLAVTEVVQEVNQETKKPEIKGSYIISIDKINVKAPIMVNTVGTIENAYMKSLEKGVAHYKGTPIPGSRGNSFIFGHSSSNRSGDYKEIFKELGSLKLGDTFVVAHDAETYNYKIIVSKITSDEDASILAESKDEIVTLMTCWPPGTNAKRWVVQGKRVK